LEAALDEAVVGGLGLGWVPGVDLVQHGVQDGIHNGLVVHASLH
jgi:hypothetical protein